MKNAPHSIPIEKKEMILAVAKMKKNGAWRYPLSYIGALFDVSTVWVSRIAGPRRGKNVKGVWNTVSQPYKRRSIISKRKKKLAENELIRQFATTGETP